MDFDDVCSTLKSEINLVFEIVIFRVESCVCPINLPPLNELHKRVKMNGFLPK